MNNRLDFISSFEDGAIEKMTEMRVKFMALDEELRVLANQKLPAAAGRTLALARTNLEMSLQYAIKSLCLLHEKFQEPQSA